MNRVQELRSTPREIRMYHWEIAWRATVLFAAVAFYYYTYLPLWCLVLVSVLIYPGIYLRVHDIGHSVPVTRYGIVARLIPTVNPIWGGTRVFAKIHLEHHSFLGTRLDPWRPYYMGHPLKALLYNFIEPEVNCFAYIQRYSVDWEMRLNLAINICLLAIGVVMFEWVYLLDLFILRAIHAVAIFFFNFYTHRESFRASAPVGAYERENDLKAILPLMRLIWGYDLVDGLIYHNRHHCLGQISVPVQKYRLLVDTGVYTQFQAKHGVLAES